MKTGRDHSPVFPVLAFWRPFAMNVVFLFLSSASLVLFVQGERNRKTPGRTNDVIAPPPLANWVEQRRWLVPVHDMMIYFIPQPTACIVFKVSLRPSGAWIVILL